MLKRWYAQTCTLANTLFYHSCYTHGVWFLWKRASKDDLRENISLTWVMVENRGEREDGLLPWILRAILRQHRALNPASSSETPPRLPGGQTNNRGQRERGERWRYSDRKGQQRLWGKRRRHGWGQSRREAKQTVSWRRRTRRKQERRVSTYSDSMTWWRATPVLFQVWAHLPTMFQRKYFLLNQQPFVCLQFRVWDA